jgi:hypothetical protein
VREGGYRHAAILTGQLARPYSEHPVSFSKEPGSAIGGEP